MNPWRRFAIDVILHAENERIMSVTIELDLPEGLVQQARQMVLLDNGRMGELLADEVRRRTAGQELKKVLDDVRNQPGESESMVEINAEVKASRAERRAC